MAEVTIITPAAQVQTVAAGGQQTQSATEAGTPAPNLQQGAIISGTIVGKDTSGNFLLRTSQGNVALRSSAPLTYNSDVVIRIDTSSGGVTNARIVTVNGEPFAAFSAPQPETSDTLSPSLLAQASETSGPPSAASESSTAANFIRAVIIAAPPTDTNQTAQVATANTQLVNGANVVIRVTQAAPTTFAQQVPNADTATPVTPAAQTQQPTDEEVPANIAKLLAPAETPSQNAPAPATPTTQTPAPALIATPTQSGPQASAPQTPAPAVVTSVVQSEPQTLASPAVTAQVQPGSQAPAADIPAAAVSAPATQTPASSSLQYAAYVSQPATSPAAPASPVTSPATPPATTNTIQGQVITAATDGTVTVQTPAGAVTVKADPLPPASPFVSGTNVSIELPSATSASISISAILQQIPVSTAPATLTELATSWQTLSDIINLVSAANTPAATALIARLPQLGPTFIATSTEFVTMLTQGNIRKLLGDDTLDILRQNGRDDLLEKFSGELSNLSQSFSAPAERQLPGWQTLFLPFVYQQEIQQARLYIKRDTPKKEREGKKSGGDTRFVVEVDLSELGPLQMDGLVRPKPQSTMFDLMIRSATEFSKKEQSEIAAIFAEAAELTGFRGSITFQVTKDFPVKPLDEITSDSPRSITV